MKRLEHTEMAITTKKPVDNKKKIYKAVRKLLATHNFEDVTVRMICSEAGVSIGTFYHYYPSKYNFMTVFDSHLNEFYGAVQERTEREVCSAREKVIKYFVYQSEYIGQGNNIKDTMDLLIIQLKNPNAALYSRESGTYSYVLELLKKSQAEGDLQKAPSLDLLADFLFATFRGLLVNWKVDGRPYSLHERTEIYISAIINAYQG